MSNPTILFTEYQNEGDEIHHYLPANWAICRSCNGNGTTTAHIENDGGGITADEMEELGEDFRHDYMSGVYDRPCPHCNGSGKVKELDRGNVDKELLTKWDEFQQEEYEYRQMCEMERKLGC